MTYLTREEHNQLTQELLNMPNRTISTQMVNGVCQLTPEAQAHIAEVEATCARYGVTVQEYEDNQDNQEALDREIEEQMEAAREAHEAEFPYGDPNDDNYWRDPPGTY
jgi:hypothetical protein